MTDVLCPECGERLFATSAPESSFVKDALKKHVGYPACRARARANKLLARGLVIVTQAKADTAIAAGLRVKWSRTGTIDNHHRRADFQAWLPTSFSMLLDTIDSWKRMDQVELLRLARSGGRTGHVVRQLIKQHRVDNAILRAILDAERSTT